MKINVMWFRRDLRLEDNTALSAACERNQDILPLFIFDKHILDELPKDDARVGFIYSMLSNINQQLHELNGGMVIKHGTPKEVWEKLIQTYDIDTVFFNRDYEPYARNRDQEIKTLLKNAGIKLKSYKDHVIFEPDEILKTNNQPYAVYTPYKKKWLQAYTLKREKLPKSTNCARFMTNAPNVFPSINDIGFVRNRLNPADIQYESIKQYDELRDFPAKKATTFLGPHLRFGTISIRKLATQAAMFNQVFLSELIWREFFMQILFHFPQVINSNYNSAYDNIPWRNDKNDFERWCNGTTGYPLVDAGMRELNATGFMHNRVRMVTAGFLCKHLLIDWRWGEAYFAEKLFDFELASNNGNWQWASGTGCDAVPYFRVFNPIIQATKFDPLSIYINQWVPELGTTHYPKPIVEHTFGRQRAIDTYKYALRKTK